MLAQSAVTTNVAVSDLERARRFYVERLGLRVRDGPEPAGEEAVVLVAGDGTRLRLHRAPDARPSDRPVALFAVPDVQQAVQDLGRRGVRFEGFDQPDEVDARSAWFRDPDGNVLGIHRAFT